MTTKTPKNAKTITTNTTLSSIKHQNGSPHQKRIKGEPYIFYNTWLTRKDAIRLLKHKETTENLRIIIIEVLSRKAAIDLGDFKSEILIEFSLENLRFCFQKNYCAEQISTFMSIINFVFNVSLKKKMTASDSFEKLEDILARHIKQVPPFSIKIFSLEEKEDILEHVQAIYKFFLMYEISLTKFVDYNIFTVEPFTKFVEIEKDLWQGEKVGKSCSERVFGDFSFSFRFFFVQNFDFLVF